ncbi:MAG TPA: rhodanese-like domain-containing protein [Polyangiaceae bacterium]|nr:rhodanese-like domain-containing protein [Polyangiaceae bacterium]
MAEVTRVSPEEARELLAQGYTYVDVRTEAEFEAGRVPGAVNVPYQRRGPQGLALNADFLSVMEAAFPKDGKVLLGCQTGNRSLKAAQLLLGAGYSDLRELRTGLVGSRDAFGRPEPGWEKKGFPVERGAPEGRRYSDLLAKRG